MLHKRWAFLAVAGCAVAFIVGGTVLAAPTPSSRTSARVTGVQHARQQIAKYSKPVAKFVAPGPAISAGKLKGKTVWYIPIIYDIPIFHTLADALTNALQHAGVKTHVCNGKGSPVEWGKCLTQAVQTHVGGIVTDSIPPNLMSVQIAAAKSNHIPLVLASLGFPHGTKQTAYASYDYALAGRLMADGVIADSNGKANVIIGETSNSSNTPILIGATKNEFSKYCPGCTYHEVGVTDAEWSTRLQPLTSSTLLKYPDTDYVIPEYDGMTPFMSQGIQTAVGATSPIKIWTFNADLAQMQAMRQHQQFLFGDVGVNSVYAGWTYADQILRLMLGENPVQHYVVATRIFTRSNIGKLRLTNAGFQSGEWYGKLGYRNDFLRLWHVK